MSQVGAAHIDQLIIVSSNDNTIPITYGYLASTARSKHQSIQTDMDICADMSKFYIFKICRKKQKSEVVQKNVTVPVRSFSFPIHVVVGPRQL